MSTPDTMRRCGANGGRPRRQRGFTLMEMMAVIVIVGILAAVSYPSYQNQVRKSRRSDARNLLLDAANREEQHILDRGRYTVSMTDLGFAADPAESENGYYSVSADVGGCGDIRSCHELTATAQGAQTEDAACREFTVDSTGARSARSADGVPNENCW